MGAQRRHDDPPGLQARSPAGAAIWRHEHAQCIAEQEVIVNLVPEVIAAVYPSTQELTLEAAVNRRQPSDSPECTWPALADQVEFAPSSVHRACIAGFAGKLECVNRLPLAFPARCDPCGDFVHYVDPMVTDGAARPNLAGECKAGPQPRVESLLGGPSKRCMRSIDQSRLVDGQVGG
jgi:hypothetical protein